MKRRLWWTPTVAGKAMTMPQICQMHAYTGLQSRIKDKNQFSEYTPSVDHSLIESIRLFCCIEAIIPFFICPRTLTSFSHHLTTGRIYWIIVSKESNYKSKTCNPGGVCTWFAVSRVRTSCASRAGIWMMWTCEGRW